MKRHLPILLAAAAVLTPLFFMHSCANTTQPPTGGLKDTIPPYIIDINPLPGAVNVPRTGAKFVFTFNEYCVIKNQKNIFLSPPVTKPVKARFQGKNLLVSFEDTLKANTTYTLSFTDAIADNNEGNMFPGFSYAFSTGERIDSMMITGTVRDCNTLKPVKGATVMVYKNHSDSAIFLERPFAAAKTDDWGYFSMPYLEDTLYRLYAIKDASDNNIYDPDNDLVAFCDTLVRPVMVVNDTIPEMLKYEMKDTVSCLARRSEYELNLFREKPTKQYIVNKVRPSDKCAYITFMAPNAWIDSLWIKGYRPDRIISEFNILQDSLVIWLNDRRRAPDTLHLYVNYRKTDSTGILKPFLEHVRLTPEGGPRKRYVSRRDIKHEDTTCMFKLDANPETVEQNGLSLEFTKPVVTARFDSMVFRSVNPRQKEERHQFSVERDSLNLRRYIIRPRVSMKRGYDYYLRIPARTFRDIDGFYSDSTEVKYSLPEDETLSILKFEMKNVKRKYIVDLQDEKSGNTVRSHIIDTDCSLDFPYLKEGSYCLRITADGNRNSIVDTGSLLEHRQPEKVIFYSRNGDRFIKVMPSSEITQEIDLEEMFK